MRIVWENIVGIHVYTMGKLRKLYDWVLSWGNSKYGAVALCCIAFIESSFFLIPPDVLLIALCTSRPDRAFWYAFLCSISSVLGGIFGWFIGYALYESVGKFIITALGYEAAFETVGHLFADNAFWAIFAAAFTPIPYKVFTIASGVWHIPLTTLILASLIGRSMRFFLVSALLYWFGARIKVFIDKYFNIVTIAACVLLVGGFVAVRWL